jgi:type IV conjugative transfer system protein TraE
MAEKSNSSYLDTLSNAFSAVKAWRAATFALAGVMAILAYALVYQARNTPVLVVPHNFAAETGRMQVAVNGELRGTSVEYMANLALSDLGLILNFTPDNVISQHQRFLNRVTEDLYGTQREPLLAQADEYKRRAMTQSFFPEDVKVSSKADKVEITGTQIRWLGGKELLRNRVTYVVSYKIYKGFAHVADLRQKSQIEK